jgi:hypothetical protein
MRIDERRKTLPPAAGDEPEVDKQGIDPAIA